MSPFYRWKLDIKKLPKVTHIGCSKSRTGVWFSCFQPQAVYTKYHSKNEHFSNCISTHSYRFKDAIFIFFCILNAEHLLKLHHHNNYLNSKQNPNRTSGEIILKISLRENFFWCSRISSVVRSNPEGQWQSHLTYRWKASWLHFCREYTEQPSVLQQCSSDKNTSFNWNHSSPKMFLMGKVNPTYFPVLKPQKCVNDNLAYI